MKRYLPWTGLMAGMAACMVLFPGCERQLSGDEPPMRPLVYTELPPEEKLPEEAAIPVVLNVAPEDLGYALFHALIDHDREAFESMFISAHALSELVHMPPAGAEKSSRKILAKSERLWTLFSSKNQAEEPVGGLSSRLRLSEFRLGKGRTLAGKIASPEGDEIVQHWGNEIRIELLDSSKSFTVRVPKIVKTPLGWRVAQPIEIDRTLEVFLDSGMHLKSELLTSEHYPMPLEVGNFWKYGVERNTDGGTDGVEKPQVTVTEKVTDIVHREGYRIVMFERTRVDPSKASPDDTKTETFAWLVTPRMIFPCRRDCRNNADNIGYLLGYALHQTPIFRFPLEVGEKWSMGGKRENYSRYEVRAYHKAPVSVPDGAFIGVYEIFGSIEEGRESRYFMPGTGVVMRQIRSGAGQKREVLLHHRLIL